MKSKSILLSLFLLMLSGSFLFGNLGQAGETPEFLPAPSCAGSVASGCVGESGQTFTFVHVVTQRDVDNSKGKKTAQFCLETVSSSLCIRNGAAFSLSNGTKTDTGDLSEGHTGKIQGKVGDEISLTVTEFDKMNGFECVRLGDLCFNLGWRQ